jgi:phage shock protein A
MDKKDMIERKARLMGRVDANVKTINDLRARVEREEAMIKELDQRIADFETDVQP